MKFLTFYFIKQFDVRNFDSARAFIDLGDDICYAFDGKVYPKEF